MMSLPPLAFPGRSWWATLFWGISWFCPLAGVWFHWHMHGPPAAMPGQSWAPPPHVVCHWHSTVGWPVGPGPAWTPGTACRAEVQHTDDFAPSLVDYCRTFIASSPANEGCQLGDVWRYCSGSGTLVVLLLSSRSRSIRRRMSPPHRDLFVFCILLIC